MAAIIRSTAASRIFDMRFDGAVGQFLDPAGEIQRGSGLDRPVAVERRLPGRVRVR